MGFIDREKLVRVMIIYSVFSVAFRGLPRLFAFMQAILSPPVILEIGVRPASIVTLGFHVFNSFVFPLIMGIYFYMLYQQMKS